MWLNKYPDGGEIPKKPKTPKEVRDIINQEPAWRKKPLPTYDLRDPRVIDAEKRMTSVGTAKEQTPAQKAKNLQKKINYAAEHAPYTQVVNGELKETYPNYNISGEPVGPNEKRFEKGLEHINKGVEVAGYLTGAVELYSGLKGLRRAAAIKNLGSQEVLSSSSGMDAVLAKQPGYNAHLYNHKPYVPPTTDPKLMSYTNSPSEINWGKWNEEIPNNPSLLKEYNKIEQATKTKGTWMKNPDGSPFTGTPEQFVQQNSYNFKKAFPQGHTNVYRGVSQHNPILNSSSTGVFTADKELAKAYASPNGDRLLTYNDPAPYSGLHELAHPKSNNSLTFDGMDNSWAHLPLKNPIMREEDIRRNIPFLEKQLADHKDFLASGTQNSDLSWSFPNHATIYSDYLYKQGTSSMEKTLNSFKDRLKNINTLVDKPEELEKMKGILGDITTTDDVAKYMEKKNMDFIKIKNIYDGSFGDVSIVNHKPGNYLKSLRGNNGMFDMTNPNIYKALIPTTLAVGAAKSDWLNKY